MIDGTVRVPAAVRAVISIRVIGAVRAIVGISAGTIAVVARVVPSPVVDIGVVVVNDGGTAAATSPIQSPGVPAPAEAGSPSTTTESSSDCDCRFEKDTNGGHGYRRRHVERHHHGRAVNH